MEPCFVNPIAKFAGGKGWADYTEEYYHGEWLVYEYGGSVNGVTYKIEISLKVEHLFHQDAPDEQLTLYDMVTYNFSSTRGATTRRCGIPLNASYRGNQISDNYSDFLTLSHLSYNILASEILINEIPYNDVWYSELDIFPVYVKKGRGIIAFTGLDNELWVMQ